MSLNLAKLLKRGTYPAATVKALQGELDKVGIDSLEKVGNIPVLVRTGHGVDLEGLVKTIMAQAKDSDAAATEEPADESD